MISCTEFIPAYSELFKFLERRGGKPAVIRFWQHLSDSFLGNLRQLASEKGLAGCFEYWSHTLAEEAADFRMTLEQDTLQIEMRACPSKGRLLADPALQPYPDYCEHCDLLYRRVLEPLGLKVEVDLSQTDQAKCLLTVRNRGRHKPAGGR
jgi:hypothetical protein